MFTTFDHQCMMRALELASTAKETGEVPIGAVLTLNDQVIAGGYNQSIAQHDPTAHAEIVALRSAAKKIGNYRLVDTTLYTTLEPCCMCAGAIVHARIKRVVFATQDPRAGAAGTVFNLLNTEKLNHACCVEKGLLANESSLLLKEFFREKRKS
ncbi:MAG: tRNA adenosine(34) deaminase TadA [Pseudomonadota bacterium]